MKQRKIKKYNNALLGTVMGFLNPIISAKTQADREEANRQFQMSQQMRELERQNRIQTFQGNMKNAMQQQANLKDIYNTDMNRENDYYRNDYLTTVNTNEQFLKMGGKRKFCKYGNNALSNIKNIGRFI